MYNMFVFIKKIFYYLATYTYNHDLNLIKTHIDNHYLYITNIDNFLVDILCVAEDKRFFQHGGFDFWSALSFFYRYIFYNVFSGASTIDQQLVRTITLDKRISITRKIKEIVLSVAINYIFNKNIIAKSYIYFAYYGWHMNGYNQAINRIRLFKFELPVEFILVSLLKYPLPKNPTIERLNKIIYRAKYIQKRLLCI